MRSKMLLLILAAAPFAGGCNIYYYAAKNILNEPYQLTEQLCRHHDLRSEAKIAWQEVRMQYPRCMFTGEFYDGFIDGFSDYLDRGGNAQPPAVAPKKYSRNKYLNAEGHALVQDYFLGFQYGVDVALATDQRKFLTVPVLLPTKPSGAPIFNVQRGTGANHKPSEPLTPPREVESRGPVPIPNYPVVTLPGSAKAEGALMSRQGGGNSAIPTPMPAGPTKFSRPDTEPTAVEIPAGDRLPATQVPTGPMDPATAKQMIPIPPPPKGVPVLPDNVPTPSVLDDLPMLPANHMYPEPLPMTYPTEAKPAVVIPESMPKAKPQGR